MANSFSVKIPVVSGTTTVLAGAIPFSGNIGLMVMSSDIAATWEIYIDRIVNSIGRVGTLSLSSSNSGGTLSADTIYYFRVTTVDASGLEGPPCDLQFKKTGGSNLSSLAVTWPAVTSAAAYRVYASSLAGAETLQAEVTSPSFTLTAPPINQSLQIPTLPDIYMITPVGASVPIPTTNILLAGLINVYVKTTTSGNVAFSCIVSG